MRNNLRVYVYLFMSVGYALESLFVPQTVSAHAGAEHGSLSAIIEHLGINRDVARTNIVTRAGSVSISVDACHARKEVYKSTINTASLKLSRDVGTLDTILDEVVNYYRRQNRTINSFSQVHEAVMQNREAALIDVGVLGILNREINCDFNELLVDLVAFRESVPAAQRSVRVYQESLVSLMNVLRDSGFSMGFSEGADSI